jgi:hypothetical protein
VSGVAKLVLSSTEPVGRYPFTATYSGDTDYVTSISSTLTEVIDADTTTTLLTSSANPTTYGAKTTLKATVKPGTTGTPTGTVVFKTGTISYPVALSGGVAQLVLTPVVVGSFPITATYEGSTDYLTSTSSIVTEVVNPAPTTTTLASSLNPSTSGQAVTLTATVSSTIGVAPSGTVEFTQNGANLGTITLTGATGSSSVAKLTTTSLSTGTDTIQAVYLGTTTLATSQSAKLSQVVK